MNDQSDKYCKFCRASLSQREREPNYLFKRRIFCTKYCARKYNRGTLKERLEKRSIPEPNSGCWLWFGAHNNDGYGSILIEDTVVSTHRASWEAHFGQIPDGLWVLHKCDNPACINPDHLFLGNSLINVHDMLSKGRHVQLSGEQLPQSRLTVDAVRQIRTSDASDSILAKKYNVSRNAIRGVRDGNTWKGIK